MKLYTVFGLCLAASAFASGTGRKDPHSDRRESPEESGKHQAESRDALKRARREQSLLELQAAGLSRGDVEKLLGFAPVNSSQGRNIRRLLVSAVKLKASPTEKRAIVVALKLILNNFGKDTQIMTEDDVVYGDEGNLLRADKVEYSSPALRFDRIGYDPSESWEKRLEVVLNARLTEEETQGTDYFMWQGIARSDRNVLVRTAARAKIHNVEKVMLRRAIDEVLRNYPSELRENLLKPLMQKSSTEEGGEEIVDFRDPVTRHSLENYVLILQRNNLEGFGNFLANMLLAFPSYAQ